MGGMGGGQGGFHGNIDPEELFRFPPFSSSNLPLTTFSCQDNIWRSVRWQPICRGHQFWPPGKRFNLGQTRIFTFQGGGGAEQFDFGPKEYHVTLSFQQAAMGVCIVRFTSKHL